MAEFEAIGKALQIPQSVLNNIEKIDQKINLIASDSEKMATHFMSAMTRMRNGSDGLLQKLQAIQGVINGLGSVNTGGLGNVGKGMGNTATQAEKAAASISEAASALNRFVQTWKGSGRVTSMLDSLATREQVNLLRELNNQAMQTSRTLTQMNRENSLEARKKANETKIASQEETNATNRKMEALKRENAQTKINTAEYRNYVSALTMSEGTENSRIKKIERMNTVLSELQRKESLYSNEIEITRKKIEQLTRENESLARVRDKANKQRTDERTNTQALNAYNRAMAASEALVTQRINKIAKLRQAEEMLRSASGNYATQLNRINQEIARLNRLNEGQVDSYGRVIRSQRNLVNTSQQLTRQLALLFSVSQIEGYISKLVQVRGEFELQQVALTSILQNKDQADQLFAQITDLAVRSPFTIKELTTYTKSLAAYQVQYEDLYDTTKMLADVSAGLGVDMQRLILAFGQVKAANFLRGTETRQFTEAGINMLGELSKYYTELEGRIVSVQEVQDRQFKRMISFKDVEEVFKRLTSAGGMFYNMQERQAETLAGQMSNLRDQFDLMFNEIGKDNQGAINTSISAINLLIENWEIFANMLKAAAVGLATYTTTTLIAAAANGKFAASAVAATTSTKGLVGITAKLITSMKAFGTFLKTNPITIIATALATAIYFWNDHRKAVEENRKAYDPLVNSVNKTITAVDELTKKIGEQNDRIKTANDNVSQYEKGTSEYARAEANANEEREKQNRLLEELKTKYPEIYNGIIRQKDGTVDYANALKEFNGQLEQQNYLNYLARQTATGSDNGLLADASKAAEEQQNLKIATDNADNALILMMSRMREYFATNQYASQDLKKQLDEIANSSLSSGEKIYKMFNMIINEHGVNIGALKDIAWDFVDVGREAMKASNEAKDANERLAESTSFVAEEFKKSVIDTGKVSKEEAQEILEMFLKNIGIQNKAVLDFVKQQFEVTIGVKLDLSNNVKQEMGEVEKRVNDYLDENQFNLVGRISLDENFEQYMKELQNSLNSWQKELNELESATGERVAGSTNKKRIDELKTSIAQATETLKYWGKYQTQTTGGGSSKNPELDKIKEQVAMIEKAAKAYEDYRKLYDEETAQRMVETAFEKPFDNLDLNFDMTFDAQGIIAAYRQLAQSVGGDAQEYIEGKIAEGLTDVTTEQRTKEVEEYRKQIDELFASLSNYQELEKLGLNKDLISQLFGINVSSINDVQDVFEKIKTELKKYGNEGEKLIYESEKKITDAQQKELQDRMKKYATYLTKQYSEIANIRIKLQKEMYEVDTLNMSDVQKQSIKQRLQDEANKQIQKLTWEDFKASDMYTQMFDDLDKVSTKGLDYMVKRLEELKGTLTDLDPTELKEIIKAINDIKEEQLIRNPLEGISGDVKSALDFAKQRKELEEQITSEYEKQKELRKQIPQQEQNVENARNYYGQMSSVFGKDSAQANIAKGILDSQEESLSNIKKDLTDSENKAKKLKKQYDKGAEAAANIAKRTSEFAEKINIAVDSFSTLVDGMNSIFNMSDGFNDVADSLISFGNNMANTASSAGSAFASFATGNIFGGITSSISAIEGLFSSIGSLFSIGDKKKERQIQRQLELVEDLQHAYEKLEEAIENAYSIDQLNAASDQAESNLKEQAAALEEAIRLEEDKKKTDKDKLKEYQQQLEGVYDQLEELQQEKISKVTNGILDDVLSAADEFTNAWLESFRAVGDGMDGLNENFQSMLEDMLKRQASMLITGTYLDRWKRELEKYINADDLELTAGEAKNWVDAVTSSLPGLNQALEEYFKAMQQAGFDLSGKGEGDTLTGLSKSISGLSEQQADALAALCESIRFFTSDSNAVLHSIYNFLLAPPAESPLMQEMRVQTTHLSSIDSLLGSVIKNSSGKGRIMRVEIV